MRHREGQARSGPEEERPAGPEEEATRRSRGRRRPVKVLYIAGIGRSGSTLLARALAGVGGLAAVGEAMHFYGRGLTNNELCACGRPVRECPLWGRVAEALGDGDRPLPSARIERFRHRATEGRHLPATFSPWRTPRFESKLRSYRSQLARLYAEIRRATGARAIVDSSKNAGYARVLQGAPGIELHLVHLIRDSRGVAHSLQKRKRRPGVPWRDGEELLDRRRPTVASLFWSAAQVMVESLRSGAAGYVRVRYRDFVRSPAESLRRVLASAGEYRGGAQLDHVGDGAVELRPHHVLAGNPVREEAGEVTLDEDVAWRRDLGAGARRLVTALTFPLLARYGYLSSGRGEAAGAAASGPGGDGRRGASVATERTASDALEPSS